MKIKGPGELRKIMNIGLSSTLRHDERCTQWDIAKASGDPRHFYDTDMMDRLVRADVFMRAGERTFVFDRKRLYGVYDELEMDGMAVRLKVKTPLRW